MKDRNFEVVAAQSNLDWTGRKLTGSHNGTIDIKEGTLSTMEGSLTGGKFIIDITSIKVLDITDPVTNAQFAGHLASNDFFASAHYPEAKFVFTSVVPTRSENYLINGDLTIKGITHPILFNAMLNISGNVLIASGKLNLDRTLYGMKFRSGNFFRNLGDAMIYDEFEVNVNIAAVAVAEYSTPIHILN